MAEFEFLNINSSDIAKRLITEVEDLIGEPLYPGDERRLFLEAFTAVLVSIFNDINDACKQRMLDNARNAVLDALGARMQVERLQPEYAKCTLRFSLVEPRDRTTYIDKGTRATADGKSHFATLNAGIIPAGSLYVDIEAQCTVAGADYNGFSVGAIQTLTDLIPFVSGVTNLDETHGGDNGEPQDDGGDGDSRYKERIRLAPAKLSTAGPHQSYIYHALSASPLIKDVNPINDHEAGTVELIITTYDNGGMPSEDVLKAVKDAVNDIKVRPLNDYVIVEAPRRIDYDIELKYYVTAENEKAVIETIEGQGGSIDLFNEWQQEKVGRDINPDKLRALILAPATGTGALRVDIIKPEFTELTERDLAKFSGSLITSYEVTTE